MKKNYSSSEKLNHAEIASICAAATTGAAGTTTAVFGETIAWTIFSAGKGAALTGICETNAFLAWLGGGSLAAGGSGMAGGTAVLAAMGPAGWITAGVGAVGIGLILYKAKKRKKLALAMAKESDCQALPSRKDKN